MTKKSNYMVNKIYEWLVASLVAVLGYLSPIKGIAHMMIIFFFIDIYYGWRADRKLNGASFSPKKIWKKTVPRMLLSIVLLVAAFMLDKETEQTWISTHKILGWFISSLLIISIAKNGYLVTNWTMIRLIGDIFRNKVKSQTGQDINFDDDEVKKEIKNEMKSRRK